MGTLLVVHRTGRQMPPNGALTIADFRATYGVGRRRTYELIASGELAARKCGKRTLITRANAERLAREPTDHCRLDEHDRQISFGSRKVSARRLGAAAELIARC